MKPCFQRRGTDLLVVMLQSLEGKLPITLSVDIYKLPTANSQRSVMSRRCPGWVKVGTVSPLPLAFPDSQCGL